MYFIPALTEYIDTAMNTIRFEKMENGEWYAGIPRCVGVWASGSTKDHCLKEIQEVLEDWLLLKLRDGDPIPSIGRTRLLLPV